jgi:MFS family permease
MNPGPVYLGLGTGEALNEYSSAGLWPGYDDRQGMMKESIDLIRLLWTGGEITFDGDYYTTRKARLYTAPERLIPLLISSLVLDSAYFAGFYGDGLVTAALLLSIGLLADMHGRVKLFQLGFLIFTVGSILLWWTPGTGEQGALEPIIFRLIQAVGGAFTMANGAAIITDSFPASERGKALGINMVAVMSDQFIGLILGGISAVYDWRYVSWSAFPSPSWARSGPTGS